MASNVRQERRRRIVERGSDRLALITGQIQNLNESPSSTPTYRHHGHTESSPSIILTPDNPSKIIAGQEDLDSPSSIAKLVKLRTIGGGRESSPRRPESRLQKSITNPNSETKTRGIQIVKATQSSVPNAPNHYKFFSSKRINSCIISSEKTRAICSLIIASLVVVSFIDYPLLGFNIVSAESFLASKPLYIILFTDATIVLAALFRDRENDEADGERKDPGGEGDNWDGAVKLLERGLVLYQAMRGIFIDCSVYLVVVICGLSLV